MSFRDRRFAIGKFPSSEQNPKNSKDVRLILTSKSHTKLPMEIRKSMNETTEKSKRYVEMLLEFTYTTLDGICSSMIFAITIPGDYNLIPKLRFFFFSVHPCSDLSIPALINT